jgi:O-antigen/teichoic acid export membrane protein
MRQHLKRLGSETAIYGTSTILGRFLNFLLVPFYTNVLVPGEYGIVAYAYSIIAFINVVYVYGMESAYFKYTSTLELGTPKNNFSTPFLSILSTSVLFSCLVGALANPIAHAMNIPAHYESIILYAAGILALDAMAVIPFAALRMEHKAKLFATIKFVNIFITVVMNIILLVVLKTGLIGIFISGFIASALTLIILLPTIIRHFMRSFDGTLMKALLRFGLPSIPAGLAAMVVQVIDRPILRALTDDATVGIYQANYRLGIIMMIIVSMYDFAWRPFYFSMAKEPNAKEIFARVLTYLLLFMSAAFLVLTLFIGDIVQLSFHGWHIIHPQYWSGLNIVPIVLLGYLFLGIYTNLSAGIYIEKKTKYLPLITFISAAVNVVANYLLIPSMGMLGAAWATFWAYCVMAIVGYVIVQRMYPIKYEYNRLLKIAGSVAIIMILYYYFLPMMAALSESNLLMIVSKVGLLMLFIALMYMMGFFEKREISVLRQIFLRGKSVPAPMDDGSAVGK